MKEQTLPTTWAFGLTEEQQRQISNGLEQETAVRFWKEDTLPTMADMEHDTPCILWLSSASLHALQALPSTSTRHLELIPKVLLLDKHYSIKDFEEATDLGIAEIVRPPFTKKRLRGVLMRAVEVHSIHHDMLCMTREIMLERELLQRKNDLLSFLVSFFTSTTDNLQMDAILQKVYSSMGLLLPVKGMHAALWQPGGPMGTSVSLYINAPQKSTAFSKWRALLLDHVRPRMEGRLRVEETTHLCFPEQPDDDQNLLPDAGNLLCLPILVGSEQLGVLVLLTDMHKNLGRDQIAALDSAMRHLALSLNNARRFRMMQLQADFDALTGVHSRRHLEGRLEEEFERFTRYEQPLSVIIADLDHFTQVNDTHGHMVGDTVLREVGGILANSIRSTDYCARYGGEEFILLLPHTEFNKAFAFAERLRKNIAAHSFTSGEGKFSVHASLGVASLDKENPHSKESLIQEADVALYMAKKKGRNRTEGTAPQKMRKLA